MVYFQRALETKLKKNTTKIIRCCMVLHHFCKNERVLANPDATVKISDIEGEDPCVNPLNIENHLYLPSDSVRLPDGGCAL